MAFDQPTRNRLARFVGDARSLLSKEFTRQLQHEYGLDPSTGRVVELDQLSHLDDARRETARILRDTLAHYLAGAAKPTARTRRDVLDRIVREQAYTVLNRLCALRMAEARGLLIESVGRGYQSKGFQLYARLAGSALGETGDAYRSYLFSLFDEFAVDLAVLFDRFSPQGRLFPREAALLHLLDEINHPDVEPLWAEDETIGWIYQYFNPDDERRQMRAESQAPRNSRELAVRNQFFTPRYVVEFLTDNTLGRIWYEMTQGQTGLVDTCRYLVRRPNEIFLAPGADPPLPEKEEDIGGEGLFQEELLRQPVYIPHRPIKDPREIAMLDPACGSMHFGLYAFDLFERIYEEAWDMQVDGRWPASSGRRLIAEYPTQDAFLRDVPRLIVERNIHGIDIDPRAVQIAGLSLWLRAHKSWYGQGLKKPQDRPQIRRANVVCAEPMPGDRGMLDEFLKSLREDRLEALIRRVLNVPAGQRVRATGRMAEVLCDLVRTVWQEMELAGEAGSLLKIEESLVGAVAEAEKAWLNRWPLFRAEFRLTNGDSQVRYLKTVPGEAADFWRRAEALVLAALEEYAEQVQNGAGYQRRLFAKDAARGFAFVDLCRRRYDAMLMNPPFGKASRVSKPYIDFAYPNSKNDLYAAFVERTLTLMNTACYWGAITTRSGFFSPHFFYWRDQVLQKNMSLQTFVDLGSRVLDGATNEVAAYVCQIRGWHRACLFVRALIEENKETVLLKEIASFNQGIVSSNSFLRMPSSFWEIPSKPFPYWFPCRLLKNLQILPQFDPFWGTVRQGIATTDDFRFIRVPWEVPPKDIMTLPFSDSRTLNPSECAEQIRLLATQGNYRWAFHVKSSSSQPWYAPLICLIDWGQNGKAIKAVRIFKNQHEAPSEDLYFRPGFSWARRAVRLTPHIVPTGAIPSASRYMGFPEANREFASVGLMASNLASSYARIYGEKFEWPNFLVDMVKTIPVSKDLESYSEELHAVVYEKVIAHRNIYTYYEPYQEFVHPVQDKSIPDNFSFNYTSLLGDFLDRQIALKYGLNAAEFDLITRDLSEAVVSIKTSTLDDDVGDEDLFEITDVSDSKNQLSYSLGAVYGRWNIMHTISDQLPLSPPDPFIPLPACPPGMLQNIQGLPATPADVPDGYPLRISWPGVLVDDPGHSEDIEDRVREALRVVWPERADAIEQEACEILDLPSLRAYFANPNRFFDDHLKRYSKSRRYAPIYWPLSTPSGSYTLWLYYHRLSDQILYTCVLDFVDPKLEQVQREAAQLRQQSGRSGDEERDLERLTDLALELQDFRAELLRIAPFWEPNLNDGVQITAAPLWRLFQHRGWQKRLQKTWDALESGDYDWAHLAMSIWPARVVPKCVDDRSLAIAHDLEDLFWVEDIDGWRNLRAPEQEIADQKERRQVLSRDLLRDLLGELAGGAGRGLPAYQVCQHLAEGNWDDMRVALCLWPDRVAEKCWTDPPLVLKLGLDVPSRRTKTAHKRFVAELTSAGTPDLADALVAALQDVETSFDALWSELERGERDGEALALALWPERVVDKCVTDVDLAARHDLRRFFWYQLPHGGCRRRQDPQREVKNEIARRQTNPTKAGR